MPSISRFFGIVIYMYYNDHFPPHFHAIYGDYRTQIDIETLEILEGELPRRAFSLVKVVDLLPLLRGPIFEPIRQDPAYFRTVHVDAESGTICWDNHADIDPEVLYGSYRPSWQDVENMNSVDNEKNR
jgi:hypothetical protein